MLKDSLYIIQKISDQDNSVEANVLLNEQDEIFKGHFPNQPLLPGVCMLQMTKEILEEKLKQKMQLIKADDIRFTAMINPNENKEIKFEIHYKQTETKAINVTAKILKQDATVCCKVKASFKTKL